MAAPGCIIYVMESSLHYLDNGTPPQIMEASLHDLDNGLLLPLCLGGRGGTDRAGGVEYLLLNKDLGPDHVIQIMISD